MSFRNRRSKVNAEPMRVLIVEDEERLAENIAAALREGPGYAVDIAGDGETGAYLAERGEYDLIVLDLMLPKVSGPGCVAASAEERSEGAGTGADRDCVESIHRGVVEFWRR